LKFIKRFVILIFLSLSLIYVTNITNIPSSIILFENEELNLGELVGITLKEKKKAVIETLSGKKEQTKTIEVSLLNIIPLKEVKVSVIENTKVVPLGNTIGIKLYSNGVLVIGMTEIEGKKPYENTGIKEGDLIKEVDNIEVTTTQELIDSVNASQGKDIEIKYVRDGKEYVTTMEPVETKNSEYKIGLWVRDGAVGIGTATYYEPSSGNIATLGHGILDRDTDKLISIESGELTTSTITKIKKGEEGLPGEIRGILNEEEIIGNINQNTNFGIYGNLKNSNILGVNEGNTLEVALKEEVEKGKAKILLTLEDGIRKEYEIEIKKVYTHNTEDNKSMLIEIIDKELIEKTGGIIQGMSGAPIIQNNKFVRSNYACNGKQPTSRLCSVWRNNGKTNESS